VVLGPFRVGQDDGGQDRRPSSPRSQATQLLTRRRCAAGLSSDLGFSSEARTENLRRFTEVARLFADAGVLALVSAISPYESLREHAKTRVGPDRFVMVHVATPLEVCEARDPKGLYRRARAGEITEFTGVSAPYEEPAHPDLRIGPEDGDPPDLADRVLDVLRTRGFFGV
jgi:bifunctional enzyme CysN/CysC